MRQMAIEAIYRWPRNSKPAAGQETYLHLLRGLAIDRPNDVWAKLTKVPTAKPVE